MAATIAINANTVSPNVAYEATWTGVTLEPTYPSDKRYLDVQLRYGNRNARMVRYELSSDSGSMDVMFTLSQLETAMETLGATSTANCVVRHEVYNSYDSVYARQDVPLPGYTACIAPDDVYLSSETAAPGEEVTLSFDGYSAGLNNPITKFQVYRATAVDGTYTLLVETQSSSVTVTASADNNLSYYYKVKVIGTQTGYDSPLSTAYATLTTEYTSPVAPTVTVSPDHVKTGYVTLSWSGAAAGSNNPITGFIVYKDGAIYETISSSGTSGSLVVPASETAGAVVVYKVVTAGTYSNSAASNSVNVYTYTDCDYPTVIVLSTTTPETEQAVEISWSGATAGMHNNITGYEVYEKTTENGDYSLLTTVYSITTSGSYTVTAPSEQGETRWYKIKTVGELNTSGLSIVTGIFTTKTLDACQPPTNLRLSSYNLNPSQQSVLSWTEGQPGSGNPISGYAVYSSPTVYDNYTLLGTTTGVSFQVTSSSVEGGVIYYRVMTLTADTDYNSLLSDEYVALQTTPNIIVNNSVPVSNQFHTAVQNGYDQHIRIYFYDSDATFYDDDITSDGLEYTNMFCPEEDFTIGLTPSSSVSFKMFNDQGQINNLQWGKFRVDIGTDLGNGTMEYATLGIFYADRPKFLFTDEVEVEGIDALGYFGDKSTETMSITYPITLKQLLNQVCTFGGITHRITAFINENRELTSEDDIYQYTTVRQVIGYIAEAACSNAVIAYDGLLVFTWFTETGQVVTPHDYSSVTKYEYSVAPINKLQIRNSDTDIGVVIGTGTNGYIIQQNPVLVFSNNAEGQTYGEPIYNRLASIPAYTPMTVEWFGDWSYRPGDVVNIRFDANTVLRLPIFSMRLKWQGLTTITIESTGNPSRPEMSAVNREEYRIGRKLTEINKTIDGIKIVVSEINGGNDYYTLIEQNAQAISALSESVSTLVSNEGSLEERVNQAEIKITPTNIVQTVRSSVAYGEDMNSKANKSTLISEINQSAEGVSITGDKINLTGTVTANQYFRILQDGTMKAVNADVSGTLTAGNWTFNSNGAVYTNGNVTAQISSNGSTAYYKTNGQAASYGADQSHPTTVQGNYVKLFCEDAGYGILVCNSNSQTLGTIDYADPTLICDKAANGSADNSWSASAGNIGTRLRRWDIGWVKLIHTSAQWTVSSRTQKHNIEDLPDMGSVVDKLKPVSFVYNWDKENRKSLGLILEDTNEVLPEVCMMPGEGEEGAINYTGLIAVLLKEVQSLRKRVKELEERGGGDE